MATDMGDCQPSQPISLLTAPRQAKKIVLLTAQPCPHQIVPNLPHDPSKEFVTHASGAFEQSGEIAWALLDALPCAVIVTDRQGNTLWVNRGFREICGYSFDEIKGKKPGALLQGLGTDPTSVRRIREAVQQSRTCSERLLNYDKRGRSYWISLDIAPFEIANHKGFIGIARDLTEGFSAITNTEQGIGQVGHLTEAVGHLALAANEEPELHQFFLSLADAVASLKSYK